MKSKFVLFLITITNVFFANIVVAQSASEVDMGIQFDVFRVADLQVNPIDFGTIMINGQSGRVHMDSSGAITFSGGVVQVSGFPQVGALTLDADNTLATITLDLQVDMGNGVKFTPIASATTVNLVGVPETIDIYGAIDFPTGTQTNSYSGVLNISITYN